MGTSDKTGIWSVVNRQWLKKKKKRLLTFPEGSRNQNFMIEKKRYKMNKYTSKGVLISTFKNRINELTNIMVKIVLIQSCYWKKWYNKPILMKKTCKYR